MSHNVSIYYSKHPRDGGVVNVRKVTIREKLLRLLLGRRQKLTIIVPGDSVESVDIEEMEDPLDETV